MIHILENRNFTVLFLLPNTFDYELSRFSLAKIFWLDILTLPEKIIIICRYLFFKSNMFYLVIPILYFLCQAYLIDISSMDSSTSQRGEITFFQEHGFAGFETT